MKRFYSRLVLPIVMVIMLVAAPLMTSTAVYAETTTVVSGTVNGDTTDSTLYLNTSAGTMIIKLDSNTQYSGGKLLLQGKTVAVSVYRGSDAYMHASAVSNAVTTNATVDTSNTATVAGTVEANTTTEMLYLNTSAGVMSIKLDASTDYSATTPITVGKTITVTCARGSDAYMHATKIQSGNVTTSSTTTSIAGTMIQGTIGENSNNSTIYLDTSAGTMIFKVDSDTDFSGCPVVRSGIQAGVDYYRGSDAYLHAKKVVAVRENVAAATIDTANQTTVTGTVSSESTENILVLNTGGGTMKIRLDSGVNVGSYYKVLYPGLYVQLNVARGSDAYMHAVSFLGATTTAATTSAVSTTQQMTAVAGTIKSATTELLYLDTTAGTMVFKIDSNTYKNKPADVTAGKIAAVAFYRGTDAYNHASIILTY